MAKLTLFGETFSADEICKTSTAVIGYVNGKEVFRFDDIKDFSAFKLADGEVWATPVPSPQDKIGQLNNRVEESENAILGLIDMNVMGGGF